MYSTARTYWRVMASKPALNLSNTHTLALETGPLGGLPSGSLSKVAHSAEPSDNASTVDTTMATDSVMENWR
ncbi:hypothetical protein D3C85_1432360 [compost metagenome]